jgi:pyrimidine-nucleoside phosphorylase
MASVDLGCGRRTMADAVDPAAGFTFLKKIGDPVAKGEPMVTVHCDDRAKSAAAAARLSELIQLSPQRPEPPPLIVEKL